MQFQVPQNIDMEDKIVGPLTLKQFLYLLAGGLIDYFLFQNLAKNYFAVFILIGLPVALIALAAAFLKIQEQPLAHFITAGLDYFTKPKMRLWQRHEAYEPVLTEPPKSKEKDKVAPIPKHLEKSQLEQLAYNLDTARPAQEKQQQFGQVSAAFEKLLKEEPKK